jgi:hypothetical protein
MQSQLRLDCGDLVVETRQDVEPIIERNKLLAGEPQRSGWGRHVASIPLVIIQKWLDEEYARGNVTLRPFTPEFNQLAKRKLQDPEWKYLRTDK